ncbi:OLC1v1025169C1 [Oldenlandia corymbosa var. corymbosa]|uniref:OLC1v1025169C1 n=1 Tax=Oldenlandia corymbosa var. corymbosa TaxID=529605 RepID=A0AAV1C695_OLDCO|nr:OLC1v1025169C1 [Oldenlandia corymbosa var. corymbosa]
MTDYFPEELLIEILSRVPAKSLVRFLLVSKSWYSLIRSPSFITTQLKNVRLGEIPGSSSLLLLRRFNILGKIEQFIIYPDDNDESEAVGREVDDMDMDSATKSTDVEFPLKSIVGYHRLVGTCDGLVCLADDFFSRARAVYLWNPTVRNCLELPSPTIDPSFPHSWVLGFGVDILGDYKVVRIVYGREDLDPDLDYSLPPWVEIFSLNTGFWRRIENVSINSYVTDFKWSQAFLNGALHWISYCRLSNTDGVPVSSLILRFHMDDESFNEINLPHELTCMPPLDLAVSVYEGLLSVIAYHSAENRSNCSLWVMRRYGVSESWTRLFTVQLGEGIEKVVRFRKNSSVLAVRRDELVIFDPKTSEIQELGMCGAKRSFCINNFEETLILLGRQNVAVEEERWRWGE